MATNLLHTSATATAPFTSLRPGTALVRMIAVARQRRMLAERDDAALADMGLSREMAEAEAARPFWDLAGLPTYR